MDKSKAVFRSSIIYGLSSIFCSCAVLFPTYALKYLVPFRNKTGNRARRASGVREDVSFMERGFAGKRRVGACVGTLFAQLRREQMF